MNRQTRTVNGKQFFRANFDLASIDTKRRTIDVVFVTEREVMMYNWNIGLFREILVCDNAAGDLSRLNNGAPLCDTHQTGSVRSGLGVVEKAWFENGVGRATVRFSKRADVEDVWQDVQDGCITGVSVGYVVNKYEVTEEVNSLPLYRAVSWSANEISLALVQADQDAGVGRADASAQYEVEIVTNTNHNKMAKEKTDSPAATTAEDTKTRSQAQPPAADTASENNQPEPAEPKEPVSVEEVRKQESAAARKRSSDILAAVRAAGLSIDFAQKLIDDDKIDINAARAAIIDKLADSPDQNTNMRNAHAGITFGADEREKYIRAASTGLCLRSAQVKEKDFTTEEIGAAREFRSMSLLQMAADSLERQGIKTRGMDPREIAKRAITSSTSDFPVLLENVLHKVLLNNYQAVQDTWRNFCMVGTVSDFRAHKRLRMGSFSKLDKVSENGELKNKKITDATSESISASTRGNIINVSREMIINDDLSAFTRLTGMLGRAAARSIELDVYALLAANPTMGDGVALFHANHGNLVSGAAPSVTAFDGMRVAMAKQKDPDKNDFLDIRPSVLVIGVGQGGDARVINGSQYDPDAANKLQRANKVYGLFQNIVDTPQISGNEYYAFADPNIEPVIEVAFLNGVQTPYLEQEMAFEQLGVNWRVYMDYGVGAIGWRGVVKNPGS